MSSWYNGIDIETGDQEHLLLDVSTDDSCIYGRSPPALSEYVNKIQKELNISV